MQLPTIEVEIAEAIYHHLTILGYIITPIDDSAIEPKLGIITQHNRYTLLIDQVTITPLIYTDALWYMGWPILLADPNMINELQRQLHGALLNECHHRRHIRPTSPEWLRHTHRPG